jgi:hypothetical protein
MSAFEVVTIVVGAVAIVLALTAVLSPWRGLSQLGRRGQTWFERPEDREPEDRPSEDERDDPIPRRPLRGRPR